MIKNSPKPFIVPFKPKPVERPRQSRRMSIISVFSGQAGTILCADSQETAGGYAKKRVEKIAFGGKAGSKFNVAVGAAGAGHYADMLSFELRFALCDECEKDFDPEKIIQFIQRKLLSFYETHGLVRGADNALIELIIVIQQRGQQGVPLVLHTLETAVNVVGWGTKSIGIGSYLADFILERTLTGYGRRENLITAAAYMLKEVRDNVDGCYAPSVIWLFHHEGFVESISEDYITRLEQRTEALIEVFREVFNYATDVAAESNDINDELRGIRAGYKKALDEYKAESEQWNTDIPKSKAN